MQTACTCANPARTHARRRTRSPSLGVRTRTWRTRWGEHTFWAGQHGCATVCHHHVLGMCVGAHTPLSAMCVMGPHGRSVKGLSNVWGRTHAGLSCVMTRTCPYMFMSHTGTCPPSLCPVLVPNPCVGLPLCRPARWTSLAVGGALCVGALFLYMVKHSAGGLVGGAVALQVRGCVGRYGASPSSSVCGLGWAHMRMVLPEVWHPQGLLQAHCMASQPVHCCAQQPTVRLPTVHVFSTLRSPLPVPPPAPSHVTTTRRLHCRWQSGW